MSDTTLVNQLDARIETLLAGAGSDRPASDPELAKLLLVAAELRALPDPEFRARLKSELLDSAAYSERHVPARRALLVGASRIGRSHTATESDPPQDLLPTLSMSGRATYPVQRGSFMASVVAHFAALALLVTSGIWAAHTAPERPRVHSVLVTDISYVLPPASTETHGGGGGGDHDPLQASKGAPPRFASQQLVPPAIVVRAEQPKLPTEQTVVGPPNLSFPQTSQLGDPLSAPTTPSNGPGSEGGIGDGNRGGVGPGNGPGVGPGSGGGIGGGPYVAGAGITAPRTIYDPEPDYSDEARKQKYQGTVILQVVVGADGRPSNIRVVRTLGLGLDEKAIEAVRQWRFVPGKKDGQPVAVVVNVQVNFRLY